MSTPTASTEPTPSTSPAAPALGPVAPIETAPSALVPEGPTVARIIGFFGLFFTILGLVVIVTTRAVGPRWVPETWGFFFGAIGLALMLYHAISDGEQEVRRMYGVLAGILLVVAVAFGFLPGPFESGGVARTMGYYLVPWGLAAGLLSLLFAVPFIRYETDAVLRDIAQYVILGVGALLCVGVVVAGVAYPDFLTGPGVALALLGLAYVCGYLSQVDTTRGLGYTVAFSLGVLGAAVLFYAFARSTFPTVLFEGPNVLRRVDQSLDYWRVAGRAVVILLAAGVLALGLFGKFPVWLRATLAAIGLVVAGVFIAACFSRPVTIPPKPFLVPGGLILGGIGLVYLCFSLGICSDSQFVALTRRELSSYFFSPIAYLVVGGMADAEWIAYREFVNRLDAISAGGRGALPEPIVQIYFISLFPVLALTILVPLLTMRLVSEERRTGSIEVLFTVPVSEWAVVLSKFLATWFMFMLCWVPMGLYLVVFRIEGAAPFDYRPLLGFAIALAVTGASFVAMGLFFSTLTKNQIIAAFLAFVPMLVFLVCYLIGGGERSTDLPQTLKIVMKKLSYLDLWTESLSGQLPVRDLLLWASLTVFWLFLSIKALEIRRWS